MSPGMIGFFFGVAVGGLGAILLIGFLFLVGTRENLGEEIHQVGNGPPIPPDAKVEPPGFGPELARWGTLRRRFSATRS